MHWKKLGESTFSIALDYMEDYNPFKGDVWPEVIRPIKIEDITCALDVGLFNKIPYSDHPDAADIYQSELEHIHRIAYLVKNGWRDCIHLDTNAAFILQDGHHRRC